MRERMQNVPRTLTSDYCENSCLQLGTYTTGLHGSHHQSISANVLIQTDVPALNCGDVGYGDW